MEAVLSDIPAANVSEAVLWVGEGNGRARRFYELPSGETRDSTLGPPEVQYRLPLG
jgi:hypothetical protein